VTEWPILPPRSVSALQAQRLRRWAIAWVSCTKDGLLAFHWKSMMALPKIIDYMVVHELCHLHQRNHTDAFWNEENKGYARLQGT